jgi:hypothetical protein
MNTLCMMTGCSLILIGMEGKKQTRLCSCVRTPDISKHVFKKRNLQKLMGQRGTLHCNTNASILHWQVLVSRLRA